MTLLNLKRECLPLPEKGALSLPVHSEAKALGILWKDYPTVLYNVSTVDVLSTAFLHLSSHRNTSFLHIASHYFPVAGLSHLTRVQLKSPEW